MKKLLLAIVAVLILLVLVAFFGPAAYDWNGHKADIADAVRDATGRELVIDGDISVSLLPEVTVDLSGVRLSNAPGAEIADMVTVGAVSLRLDPFALITRTVVIKSLVITEPTANLAIDATGRPNWAFEPAQAATEAAEAAEAGDVEPADVPDIIIENFRLERGAVTFTNALTGQTVSVESINAALVLPGLDSPLVFTGDLVLNGEAVSLRVDVDNPATSLAGGRFALAAKLESRLINLNYDGGAQRQPAPGLDGAFFFNIESVGELAAWLDRPLAEGQPDPGPLRVTARFSADGAKASLDEMTIDGHGLSATALGSFDATGDVAKIELVLESEFLDIDRYLPPPAPAGAAGETVTGRHARHRADGPHDMMAGLPEEPFDLSPLRDTEADVLIILGGVRAMGYEIGPFSLNLGLKDGVLIAEVPELALYGGSVSAHVTLDGSADALDVKTKIVIDKVRVGELARAVTGETPVTGIASGTLDVAARGANPRALAQSLSGGLSFEMGGVDVADAPGVLSEIKLDATLPGLDSPPAVTGSVVYNGQRVAFDIATAALKEVLSGERFTAKVAIDSKLITLSYDGAVQPPPLPGLDGTFDLDVPSVGKLAAWAGQPLPKAQPDPGPLTVHAVFSAAGMAAAIDEMTIAGEALNATLTGRFDRSGDIPKLVLNVKSGVLDIDRYLPKPAPKPDAPAQTAAPAETPSGDPLAMIPDEPFDLAPLRRLDAEVTVALDGVKAAGFEVGPVTAAITVTGGVLALDVTQLGLYGGNLTGTVGLDGSGDMLGVVTALTIDSVAVHELARAATGEAPLSGIASGAVNLKGAGANPRALVENLSGALKLAIAGIELADAPPGLTELDMALDLPGLDAGPRLVGFAVYNGEKIDVDLKTGPLNAVLAGDTTTLTATVASRLVSLRYDGAVQQRPGPGLDGVIDLDIPSVGELAAWAGQPLPADQPDPGPLKLRATLAADGAKVALKSATIEGRAVSATATGSFDSSPAVPEFDVDVTIANLDLNAYLPAPRGQPAGASATGGGAAAPAAQPAGWSDEPIDLGALSMANGRATIKTGPVLYKTLTIERSRIDVTLRGGLLTATIAELLLAGGNVTAEVRVDASAPEAAIAYTANVANMQALPILKALADTDRLSGTVNLRAEGTTRGRSERDFVSALNGAGSVAFTDGTINGINLAATLRSVGKLGLGSEDGPQKTDFSELGGTYTITNGVLDNRDFRMLAPLVRVEGAGLVPMPPRMVDYKLTAKLVASLEGQGGGDALTGLPIPVAIFGPWHNVDYRVDFESVLLAAMSDPARLAQMPVDLLESVAGLGIALPGEMLGGVGDILEALPLPGIGGSDSGGGGLLGDLLGTFDDVLGIGGDEPAAAPDSAIAPAPAPAPAPEEERKSLFDDPLEALGNLLNN
jgi:uncharacterized protein involved in outer membrane biogenesis